MKHRWIVVALALFAASAFALSVQAGGWWSIGDVEVGPSGTRSPFGGAGDFMWAGANARWERFGNATWAAGLISMFVLVVVAGGVAARRVPRLAAKTALVSIATATATGIGFFASRPDNGLPFKISHGVFFFVAAVIVGVIGALAVIRAPRAE